MPSLPPSVIDQISASLSVGSLQHQVIVSNIANRDTQDYQRLKLQFDRAMGGPPTVTADPSAEPVSLEQDLIALSSNAMRFEAMAHALSRYLSIIAVITNPNRV